MIAAIAAASRVPRGDPADRQAGDRHAEHEQERDGGAEQPVRVGATARDPERVHAPGRVEGAERVEAGGGGERGVAGDEDDAR